MTRLLLRNARLHGSGRSGGPGDSGPTALAVEGGRIAWLGDEDGAQRYAAADRVVDLAGAWLAPSFTDSHLHAVQTGYSLTGLDLHGTPNLARLLADLASHAQDRDPGSVLIGQGWDETLWPEGRPPTADELERVAPGMRVCLTRVDGHSSVVSHALAAAVPGLADIDGWSDDGRVERDAQHAMRTALAGLVGPEERLAAARATCRALVRHGVTAFHENAAPHIGPEYELDLVRQAAAEAGLHVTAYWGELGALDAAQRLGVQGLAGDLVADGAVGSRTASMRGEYADAHGHCGHAYLDAGQVAEHVVLCTGQGLQAGFHCIGDAALDAVGEGFRRAAEELGEERVRAGRHRLEHVEMPAPDVVATLARLGVTASVQPVFDALWGGPDQMYAERLGARWRGMNPYRDLHTAGVPLAFGSDSPVTPLGPWAAVRAAVHHHDEAQRLPAGVAFEAHTRGGWAAARVDDAGALAPGQRADLAAWATPAGLDPATGLPVLEEGAALPRLRLAVADGRILHEEED